MNEIMESLYQRKSMRAYEDREIPEEMKKADPESSIAGNRQRDVSNYIQFLILRIRN